jgi:hypothetical protein
MENTFESWALVELMGHQRIVGKVSETEIAGAKLLRVDVPKTGDAQAITKYFGPSAIYCITPVEEDTARVMAKQIETAPVSVWDARRIKAEVPSLTGRLYEPNDHNFDDEDL